MAEAGYRRGVVEQRPKDSKVYIAAFASALPIRQATFAKTRAKLFIFDAEKPIPKDRIALSAMSQETDDRRNMNVRRVSRSWPRRGMAGSSAGPAVPLSGYLDPY